MATWKLDPSFYPSPPAETLAYVAAFDPTRKTPDSLAVVDVDPKSSHARAFPPPCCVALRASQDVRYCG
jgi:hypothetical protein